jgi:thiol-disulfide isomerase/thioredoxin
MRRVTMQRKWTVLLLVGVLISLLAGCAEKKPYVFSENEDKGKIVLYYFWGDGCPHCAAAKPVLEKINAKYPELNIRAFEVWYKKPNQALYKQMADQLKVPEQGRGVPLLLLDDQFWVGWNDATAEKITAKIDECVKNGCADAGAGIIPGAAPAVTPSAGSN